jgi:hypothetical protein
MEKSLGTGPNRNNSYHIMSNFVITVKGDTRPRGHDGRSSRRCERRHDRAGGPLRRHVRPRERRLEFKKRVASNDTAPPGVK